MASHVNWGVGVDAFNAQTRKREVNVAQQNADTNTKLADLKGVELDATLQEKGFNIDPTTGEVSVIEGGEQDYRNQQLKILIDGTRRLQNELGISKVNTAVDKATTTLYNSLNVLATEGDPDAFNRAVESTTGMDLVLQQQGVPGALRMVNPDTDSVLFEEMGIDINNPNLQDTLKRQYFVTGTGANKKLVNVNNLMVTSGYYNQNPKSNSTAAQREEQIVSQLTDDEYKKAIQDHAYTQDALTRGFKGTLQDKDRLDFDNRKLDASIEESNRTFKDKQGGDGDGATTVSLGRNVSENGEVGHPDPKANLQSNYATLVNERYGASSPIGKRVGALDGSVKLWQVGVDALGQADASGLTFADIPVSNKGDGVLGMMGIGVANMPIRELTNTARVQNSKHVELIKVLKDATTSGNAVFSMLKNQITGAAAGIIESADIANGFITGDKTLAEGARLLPLQPYYTIAGASVVLANISPTKDSNLVNSAVNDLAPRVVSSLRSGLNSNLLTSEQKEELIGTVLEDSKLWRFEGGEKLKSVVYDETQAIIEAYRATQNNTSSRPTVTSTPTYQAGGNNTQNVTSQPINYNAF